MALAAELTRLGVPDGAILVLAVSGGADSMALLHLVARSAGEHRWRVVVGHLDHGLRPESAGDASFVRDAAEALGCEVRIGSTDVAALARERRDGIEEAGRAARYAFLQAVADEVGPAAYILTAHTAEDQAETVLLHLARGSGLAGLSGIAGRRGRVVRPLLTDRRAELRETLEANGIAYRTDPSNADRRFARNRARHELLPALERLHPGATEAIARAAALVRSDDNVLEALALSDLAARRQADGWIAWDPPPSGGLAAHELRLAAGSPAPSAERIRAVEAAARDRLGGRRIDVGSGRAALLRGNRVRILHPG